MTAPLVSVVVPVWDGEAFLGPALASVRAQTFRDHEVIVVDDGSKVPVEAMVRSVLPEAKVFRQEHAGPSAARNLGLTKATGDFQTFLDADDLWHENTLALLLKALRDAPSAGVVQGLVQRIESRGAGSMEALGPPYAGFNVGALMVRREAMDAIGPFDEHLCESEDVDLFIRLKERRIRRLVIPDLVLDYRQRPGSVTAMTPPRPLQAGHVANWLRLVRGSLKRRRATASEDTNARPDDSPSSITAVLVVRQGRKYLPGALESIRRQTLAPLEILVIAGPSTDGTMDWLRAQPDVRTLEQEGTGLAAARNQALREARGTYIAFLDHDDLWRADKLEVQMRSLALFSAPAACIANFREVRDEDGYGPANSTADLRQPTRLGWTPSALVAHRDVFASVGDFDPTLGHGCDTDWFRRLRNTEIPCALATSVLLKKRRHDRNLSADTERNREAMLRMIGKHRTEIRQGRPPATEAATGRPRRS